VSQHTRQGERESATGDGEISVAEAGGLDIDQNFVGPQGVQLHGLENELCSGRFDDCRFSGD
jgi:hypothetical protein